MNEDFKKELRAELYKLSQAIDPECRPMSRERLKTMSDLICEQIDTSNKLSKNIAPYRRIINRIISGEIKIYSLSVTNLMQAFQSQNEFIYFHD